MPTDAVIEQRLAVVEAAVAELGEQVASGRPAPHWLDRFIGAFEDEPAFDEVIEYGREIRRADSPPEDAGA